jgi:hypothetical protein
MWLPIEQVAGFPGLNESCTPEKPYFERAYSVGTDGEHGFARVRFRPVAIDPDMGANIALAPRQIAVVVSASQVDAQGAVILFNGRGIVRPSFSVTEAVRFDAFDQEAFLLQAAGAAADEMVSFRKQFEAASLLIPPPSVATAPSETTNTTEEGN